MNVLVVDVGASPARAFRWRCTAAVVGSSLTRKTLYRGGVLGDSIGSRVHLPLSVKRLGKNGRDIGLPEIGHTVIVMTDWYPSRRLAASSGDRSRTRSSLPATRHMAQDEIEIVAARA